MSTVRGADQQLRRWPAVVAGLVAAAAAMVLLLRYGGGAARQVIPGLPDPGPVTIWALPAARLAGQVLAVATIGLLLASVAFSPRSGPVLSSAGYRRLRAAGWAALGWALAGVATLVFTLSELSGQPPSRVATATDQLSHFAFSVEVGQAITFSTALAAAAFLASRLSIRPVGATLALGFALLATVPPVFVGHAASAGDHQLAISSLLLHVIPVTLWAGGLLALALSSRNQAGHLAAAVSRFSPLATACLVAVAGSGVLSALVRLTTPVDLFQTGYGQLVLVKTGLLGLIAVVGWWQRQRALPALRSGDRRRFAGLAVTEIALFGAAIGTAVALSRTPPPAGADRVDPVTSLLGFAMPTGPLTARTLLTDWLPEPLFLVAALAAAGCYLLGVRRLRRRGDGWPLARTVCLLAGLAVLVLATSSGLARYGPVLFSVHMVQHLLLAMIVPILLVLAAPVTMALRALRRGDDPTWPGPREWLQSVLGAPVLKVLAHPVCALAIYVVSMYVMYLSGLFELALRSHAAHLLMILHFVGAGYLFFWVVIGADPTPRPRPMVPLRMIMVLVAMAVHAILGLVIMHSQELLAGDWFVGLPRDWGPSPEADQRTAGGIAWSFGEIPTLLVLGELFRQWVRADEREQRRLDRAADRAEAEGREDEALAAYNAMLARLSQSSHPASPETRRAPGRRTGG